MSEQFDNSEEVKQLRKEEFRLRRKKVEKRNQLHEFLDGTCACTIIHQREHMEKLEKEAERAREEWAGKKKEIIEAKYPDTNGKIGGVPLEEKFPDIYS